MGVESYDEDSLDYVLDPAQKIERNHHRARRLRWLRAVKVACYAAGTGAILAGVFVSFASSDELTNFFAGMPQGPSFLNTLGRYVPFWSLVVLTVGLRGIANFLADRELRSHATRISLVVQGPHGQSIAIARRARGLVLEARKYLAEMGDDQLVSRVSANLDSLDEAVWVMATAATTSSDPEVLAGLEARATTVSEAVSNLRQIRKTMEEATKRAALHRKEEVAVGEAAQASMILKSADFLLVSARDGISSLATSREEAFGEPKLFAESEPEGREAQKEHSRSGTV